LHFKDKKDGVINWSRLGSLLALVTPLGMSEALRHQIHDAAKKGNIEEIKRLLQTNPELINDRGEDEWTPLFR